MEVNRTGKIDKLLYETGVFNALFDSTRIVDAEAGLVHDYTDERLQETSTCCSAVFDRGIRCRNCTSIRAFYTGEHVVKLEYVGGVVMLVLSVPLELSGRPVVVELLKDITSSMTVDTKDLHRGDEVSSIISNLNYIAVTDALTGLYNRRYIGERLPNALQKCRELDKPLSVILVDIDHFKVVNDTYGLPAGDEILVKLADIIRSFIRRDSDFAARYGGEEFLLCFPGVMMEHCRLIGDRLLSSIAGAPFSVEQNHIPLTVSIGVAEMTADDIHNAQDLITLADERLYEAKLQGRNRVVSE